jgi:hypothetical protein
MSYSYIKSVFPNFEKNTGALSTIYDTQITLGSNPQSNQTVSPYETQSIPIENFGQTNSKDNLSFYVPPVPKIHFSDHPQVETFNTTVVKESKQHTKPTECDDYLRNVIKCKQCMQTLRKQLGVSSVDYEEIFEVLSFVLFGVFLYMILDKLKR